MTLDARQQKAFDFCADSTKQLLTLSTGIVAFMVTFAKDFAPAVPAEARWIAYAAWLSFFLSICCGVLVLLALTAQLEPKPGTTIESPSIWEPASTYSLAQIILFAIAMVLTIAFGVAAAWPHEQVAAKVNPDAAEQLTELSSSVADLRRVLETHAEDASARLSALEAISKSVQVDMARIRVRSACQPQCKIASCSGSTQTSCACPCGSVQTTGQ
jgi:hypothetical protein